MGYVRTRGLISSPARSMELEFLVDTGAGYMILPPAIANEMQLPKLYRMKVTLADKREIEADYSSVYVKIQDREAAVPVLIMDSPLPLLGALTLEVLGLEVDPVNGEVRPTRPFAMGALLDSPLSILSEDWSL